MWPPANHVFFIPGVFLLGLALGFRWGVRSARAALERERQERRR